MPTADASQFTTMKRYQSSINASLGANPLKFLVPSSFGGYSPSYRIGFLPPNAIVSNKEIVAVVPTSEGTATPAPQPEPTPDANSTPTGGGGRPNDTPDQPQPISIDDTFVTYNRISYQIDIQAPTFSSRNQIIYQFSLNQNYNFFQMDITMNNGNDEITNIEFSNPSIPNFYRDNVTHYSNISQYAINIDGKDISNQTLYITTNNPINGFSSIIINSY
jgi:hypothetical protein